MKNKITKEIEYMKYVLGYKRGVVISEQLTPEQIAKLENDHESRTKRHYLINEQKIPFNNAMERENVKKIQAQLGFTGADLDGKLGPKTLAAITAKLTSPDNYASTFDREIATPPDESISKPPVDSISKTPDVPVTLSAADMTKIYNFAIGDTVKNSEIGDNTSLAAIAWLIWTRDLAKAPENKANIDFFIKKFPGAQDGVKMANNKISSAKKFPVSELPEDLIKIGADYTGVNYSKESSDFGIGKSGKSDLSFNQASIAALPKLPSGTVINAEGRAPYTESLQHYEWAKRLAISDYKQKTQGQPSTPSMDSINSSESSSSFKTFKDGENLLVKLTGKIN